MQSPCDKTQQSALPAPQTCTKNTSARMPSAQNCYFSLSLVWPLLILMAFTGDCCVKTIYTFLFVFPLEMSTSASQSSLMVLCYPHIHRHVVHTV